MQDKDDTIGKDADADAAAVYGDGQDSGALYSRFLRDGDEEAFVALTRIYAEDLTAYLSKITGDADTGEELAIDALAELALGKKELRGDNAVGKYLFTIGRNLAFRQIKRQKKHSAYPFDEFIYDMNAPSPEDEHVQDRMRAEVRAALQSLEPDHRDVLRLLFFEDMTYAQAGEALNKSQGQIRGIVYRAKAALKAKLGRDGFAAEE
ncbi:MAG: sigma-70 family RNA polymerase sigma factor [Clostridiales bacterium]|nr:sigma-70 family RNA polymerase sigma factor [Clostridiales bacterium]